MQRFWHPVGDKGLDEYVIIERDRDRRSMRATAAIAASSNNRWTRITHLLCMGLFLSSVQERKHQPQQQQQQQQCGSTSRSGWGIWNVGGAFLLVKAQDGGAAFSPRGKNLFGDDELSFGPLEPDANNPGIVIEPMLVDEPAARLEGVERATITMGPVTSNISGYVFLDADSDGLRNVRGDHGIYNISVYLFTCADELVNAARTDRLGSYAFEDLPMSDENGAKEWYYISVPQHPEWYVLAGAWSGDGASPGVDNVVDPATKRSDCFDLEEGGTTASIGMAYYTTVAATLATPKATVGPTTAAVIATMSPLAPMPTDAPTAPPSRLPSKSPIAAIVVTSPPTVSPTTREPTKAPSLQPSAPPTKRPSVQPSTPPTKAPSIAPTETPTAAPSSRPSSRPSFPPSRAGEARGPVVTQRLTMTLRGIQELPDVETWAAATADHIVAHFDATAADEPVFHVTVAIERVAQVSSCGAVASAGGRRRLGQRRGGGGREQRHRYPQQGQRRQQGDKWVEVIYDQTSSYQVSSSHVDDSKYNGVYVATVPFTGGEASSAYVKHLRAISPVYDGVAVGGVTAPEGTLEMHKAEDGNDAGNADAGSGTAGGEDKTEDDRTYIVVGATCVVLVLAAAFLVVDLQRRRKKRGAEGELAENCLPSSMPRQAEYEDGTSNSDSTAFHPASILLRNGGMHPQNAVSFSPSITTTVHVIAPAGKLGVIACTKPGGGHACVCEVDPASPLLGEIQLGDKIVAVDDEYVQQKTAVDVNELLGSKSANERRKITVLMETETGAGYSGTDTEAKAGETEATGRFARGEQSEEEEETAFAPNTSSDTLGAAMEAGDRSAVGATAALIATSNLTRELPPTPSMSVFSNRELEQLVEAGDWEALVAAGSRFDDASTDVDREGLQHTLSDDLMSSSDDSMSSTDFAQQPLSVSSHGSSSQGIEDVSKIVMEIADLVKTIVPDELDNLDEMLLQLRGREEELLNTLRTIRDEEAE